VISNLQKPKQNASGPSSQLAFPSKLREKGSSKEKVIELLNMDRFWN
jgi:hypothetical protein